MNTPVAFGRPSGYGLIPRDEFVMVVNRSAPVADSNPTSETISAGEVVIFTLLSSARITADGLTPQPHPGSANSVMSCVNHKWAAAENAAGLWGVAVENIGPGLQGRVQVRGRVKCNVWNSLNAAIVPGDQLVANATKAGYLDATGVPATATAVRRVLGLALEPLGGTTSTGSQMLILFDGLNGLAGCNG